MNGSGTSPHSTPNADCASGAAAEGRPFGIYVHTPYCVHRCSYCDFYSTVGHRSTDFQPLIERISAEIDAGFRWWTEQGRPVVPARSVFFGGGTPSLFPPHLIGNVLERIDQTFGLAPGAELTLEANPETVSDTFSAALRDHSRINRVSLGVQSFDPRFLNILERRASPESVHRAFDSLRKHGFEKLSLDLIFGIPGQDLEALRSDLDHAFKIAPPHISFYNLTLKPGHPLYRQLPDADSSADLYCAGVEHLANAGYARYEISNFSRPGEESRHNQLYWDGGEFLGFGPSASSRIYRDGCSLHRKQVSDTQRYLTQTSALEMQFESTTHYQTVLESLFLELRKTEGIELSRFQNRYEYDVYSAKKRGLFEDSGWLIREGNRLRLTDAGLLLADSIAPELLDWEPAENGAAPATPLANT